MSCIGGGSGVNSGVIFDVGRMGLATARNSLGDVSLSSLLQSAAGSLSPSDYLNVPSVEDKDTQ